MQPASSAGASPLAAPRTLLPLPLLIGLFLVLWSSAFAGAKLALADCPPLVLLTARLVLAGAIMLIIAPVWDSGHRLRRRDVWALIFIGILNNSVYLGLNWTALTFTSSAYTAVLTSSLPLLVALGAGPLLGEKMNLRKWLGIALGIVGVMIVLRSRLAGAHETLAGTLLIAGGVLSLSAGTLAFKYFRPHGGVWTGNAIQCLAGGVVLHPLRAGDRESGRHPPHRQPHRRPRLPGGGGVDRRLRAVVLPAHPLQRDGGLQPALPDAAARPVLRLAAAGRTGAAARHSSASCRSRSASGW